MRKAWIENNQIRDIAQGDPASTYHPAVAAQYTTDVPDNAANGDGWVNGVLVKPVIPAPVVPTPIAPIPPTVTPVQFLMLFTPAERIAARTLRATDLGIDDFWRLLDDLRTVEVRLALPSVQAAVEYTLTAIKVSIPATNVAARKAAILLGIPS